MLSSVTMHWYEYTQWCIVGEKLFNVKYNAREDENFWLFISGAKNPNTITLVCLLQKCIDLGGQGILNSWISYQYQSHEIRKYSLCK